MSGKYWRRLNDDLYYLRHDWEEIPKEWEKARRYWKKLEYEFLERENIDSF